MTTESDAIMFHWNAVLVHFGKNRQDGSCKDTARKDKPKVMKYDMGSKETFATLSFLLVTIFALDPTRYRLHVIPSQKPTKAHHHVIMDDQ